MGLHITRHNCWCLSIVCFLMLIGSPHFEDHVFAQDNAGALAQAAEEEARVAQALADAKAQAAKDAQKALEDAATKVIAAEEEARVAQETAAAKALRAKKAREALSKAQPGLANASAKAAAMEKARLAQEKAAASEDARLAEEKAAAQAKAAEDARLAEEKAAAQAKAAEDARLAEEKAAAQAKATEDARLAEEKAAAQAKAAEEARQVEEKAATQAKAAEDARQAEEQAAEDARLAEEKAAAQAKAAEEARLAEKKAAEKAKAVKKTPVAPAKTKAKAKKTTVTPAAPIRDWSNIVGSKECGECHKAEVFTWKDTHHATTFNLLPRKKNTKAITKKMGIRSVKRDSDCLTCHFTAKIIEGKEKVISGISCESCHGPAAKWVKIHGDYGGKKVKKDMETPEHKTERLAKIEEAKMIRPQNLYRVAQNCYQCHTVPNEKLVNVGGHKPGSNFELVSWSQGEVRHNFFNSDNKENRKAAPERKRLMYVVGRALHLEYTLRGVAKSTEKAKYAVTMAKRAVKIKKDLTAIQKLINIPEIKNMLSIANGVKLKLNNESSLVEAADKIAIEAKKMAKGYTGKEWKAVDPLLPIKVKGKAGEGPPPGQ